MNIDAREVVARVLFQDRWKFLDWDNVKPWKKKLFYDRADLAIKRAGIGTKEERHVQETRVSGR